MIFVQTCKGTFPFETTKYSPDYSWDAVMGQDVCVIGAEDKTEKLVEFCDMLTFYKPRDLSVWILGHPWWISVVWDYEKWITLVPAPDELHDEVMRHARH